MRKTPLHKAEIPNEKQKIKDRAIDYGIKNNLKDEDIAYFMTLSNEMYDMGYEMGFAEGIENAIEESRLMSFNEIESLKEGSHENEM